MKLCVQFILLIVSAVTVWADMELPEIGKKKRRQIQLLEQLVRNNKATYRNNINTNQRGIHTLFVAENVKVDGEKIITLNREEITLFHNYFFGYICEIQGKLRVSGSTDGKTWEKPKMWWHSGLKTAYYNRFVPGQRFYLKFTGKGTLVSLQWQVRSAPVTLTFNPEPYLVPGAKSPVLPVKVTLDPQLKMNIGGKSEFKPRQWLRVYNCPDALKHPDYLKASEFFVPRGFAGSRDAGFKMAKTGAASRKKDIKLVDKLKAFYPDKLSSVVCFATIPGDLVCKDKSLHSRNSCPDISLFQETAKRMSSRLTEREKELGDYAGFYCEVKNESDIPTNWGYFANPKKYDGWKTLADFHNVVAKTVKKNNPGWKVGGPSSCIPKFDLHNFGRGRDMLKFFARTYDNLDYYSWHFYDPDAFRLTPECSYIFGRMDASIDLYRSYLRSMGGEKPLIITEYGGYGDNNSIGAWQHMRVCSALMVEMMDYPDLIVMAVPFIVPISWWYKYKPAAKRCFDMYNYGKDKKMYPTEIVNFIELWRNLKGTFVPIKSNRRNVNCVAMRDHKTIYAVISNMTQHRLKVDVFADIVPSDIASIEQRRLYLEMGKVHSRDDKLDSLSNIPVAFDETTIVVIKLKNTLPFTGEEYRRDFCATQIMLPTGRPAEFTLKVGDKLSPNARYCLRVGLWRNNGFNRTGYIIFNGKTLPLKVEKSGKGSYFALKEIPVPAELVRGDNVVIIKMPQSGGLVTSLNLRQTTKKLLN